MKRFLVRLVLWVFLLTGLFFSARSVLDAKKAEKVSQEAVQIAKLPAGISASVRLIPMEDDGEEGQEGGMETDGEKTKEGSEALPEEASFLADINLEALQEVNQDVLGWISLPGTKLSYPIVQGEDNNEYLYHNWKKEPSISGSIFMESANCSDFSDFHTIIYGHRMRDLTMFGVLKEYQSLDFLQEHPNIYLVHGDEICRYAVFAAYEAGIKSMVYRLDVEENGWEEEFLQFCRESSVIDAGVTPEPGAKILTLSTCTGRGHSTRWVVQGYLTEVEKR